MTSNIIAFTIANMIADNISRPADILLVEDNPGDIRLTYEALKEGQFPNNLYVVKDGLEAMEFLQGKGRYAGINLPDLILLDLNLPKMDGREVLKFIKTDEHLKHIPVVILSTTRDKDEIYRAYDLYANCFIAKPLNFDKFIDVVKWIEQFWLSIAELPAK